MVSDTPSEEYVSLGCIATETDTTPDIVTTGCKVVRREVLKECEILDCVYDGGDDQLKLWRLENSCGTFILSEKKDFARSRFAAQLRIPLIAEEFIENTDENVSKETVTVDDDDSTDREIYDKSSDETSIQVSLPRIALTFCERKRDALLLLWA